MNEYLRDFETAFKQVEILYFECPAMDRNGRIYNQKPENNFTMRLMCKFSNIMETSLNVERYYGLTTNFDTQKERLRIRPDFVLHECPSNRTRQEIVAEVKITDVSLSKDFEKLRTAITQNSDETNDLNFKYAVMIVVNKPFDKVNKAIRRSNYFRNLSIDNLQKLYLFHAVKNPNGNSATYTIKTFLEIKNG